MGTTNDEFMYMHLWFLWVCVCVCIHTENILIDDRICIPIDTQRKNAESVAFLFHPQYACTRGKLYIATRKSNIPHNIQSASKSIN